MPSRGQAWPREVRERAVRMVLEHQHEHGSQWEAICSVAEKLGPTAETVRKWVRRAEVDGGARPGRTTEENEELKRLAAGGRRVASGQRHSQGGGVFLRGGARPPVEEVVAFIDANRERRSAGLVWGVEPIC